jgi:hypothetical protein
LLQAAWEAAHLSRRLSDSDSIKKYHIFSSPSSKREPVEIAVYNVDDTGGLATETSGSAHKIRQREFVDLARRRRAAERAGVKASEECQGSRDAAESTTSVYNAPIPDSILSRDPLLLNIGGLQRTPDWVIVNSQSTSLGVTDQVDVIRKMHNLHGFPNASVSAIYSSHTLEHAGFGDEELRETLLEWRRVLKIGGEFHIL